MLDEKQLNRCISILPFFLLTKQSFLPVLTTSPIGDQNDTEVQLGLAYTCPVLLEPDCESLFFCLLVR